MRLHSSLVALVGVSLCLVAGCAGNASDEGADTQEGAATGATAKIASGIYDTELQLAVTGTHIEGSYFSSVGDPEHGGAQCYFTVSGWIENVGGVDHAHVTAVDGFGATGGEIVALPNGGVKFSTVNSMSACQRTSPMLLEGFELGGRTALRAGTIGFRSVQADKAFFYDRAGGNPRTAYVLNGDTLEVTGAEQSGYVPVSYTAPFTNKTTTGFIKAADLAAAHAPVPKDTLRGDYTVKKNDAFEGGFEVMTSDNRDMFFNLTAVNTYGGYNMGDIQMGHAKLVGDVATWQGDGCKVSFTFAAGAKTVKVAQDGACSDFGHNVYVAGDYDRK